MLGDFNPRTRVECDSRSSTESRQLYHFNPRTRVECDTRVPNRVDALTNFNPRIRVECDCLFYAISIKYLHYISEIVKIFSVFSR